jgi:tetratricopeptide (TPR) repeat protein
MSFKNSISIVLIFLLISCGNSNNSNAFIEQTKGRYLYNSDEIVEVYFKENILFMKWRGATAIKPLKVGDNTFFVKEMNEKIQFKTNPKNGKNYLVFVPKTENDTLQYRIRKLVVNENIPSEYLKNNEFDKALESYLILQKNDSLDASLNENNFNKLGYKELREKNYEKALNIFKINIALYPNSANVYDSYADALRKKGDTVQAIIYYKKSLSRDSGNRSAKKFVEKYDTKK